MEFITHNIAPIMFLGLIAFLLSGFPITFALAATGISFAVFGMALGIYSPQTLQALPFRIFQNAVMNDTLLAIPFFTFMGLVLERSGMAEDLLDTIGQLFGPVRGGLAYAVIFVGGLLAATTGVVAASVIAMGLISLPLMRKYGYNDRVATGTIAASGTLAQIIPPSLVLILLASQMGKPVGDMYKAAFFPGLLLMGLYMAYIFIISIIKPTWVPALPLSARTFQPTARGGSGMISLLAVLGLSGLAFYAFEHFVTRSVSPTHFIFGAVTVEESFNRAFILALAFAIFLVYALAKLDALVLKGVLLSDMARRVVFVLVPPLALIFLVLGTIGLGIATPTEGGGLGALGAIILAWAKGRYSWDLNNQAMNSTLKLTSFVLFILIGSSIFNAVFQFYNGNIWVEELLLNIPGGTLGFLIFINILFFVLAFFLEFFELSFILVPLIAPVAEKMGIDLIWLGVLLAVNMQTSFLHPPFGFALIYLRSVASKSIKTIDIYMGAIPFVIIQLCVVALIIAVPSVVSTGAVKVDPNANKSLNLDMGAPAAPVVIPAPAPSSSTSGAPVVPTAPAAKPQAAPQFDFVPAKP